MADPGKILYKVVKTDGSGLAPGDRLMQVGTVSFTGTQTSTTISTDLDTIEAAVVNPSGTSVDAQDAPIMISSTVSSDAVKIVRQASGASGLSVFYILVGRKTS